MNRSLFPLPALAFTALGATALALPAMAQGPLPPPPIPPQNPQTAEKAVLGKMLFWDEQLSSDGTMACGTCHMPGHGGSDPRAGGPALNPGPDGVFLTPDDIFGSPAMHGSNSFGHFVEDAEYGFDDTRLNRANR